MQQPTLQGSQVPATVSHNRFIRNIARSSGWCVSHGSFLHTTAGVQVTFPRTRLAFYTKQLRQVSGVMTIRLWKPNSCIHVYSLQDTRASFPMQLDISDWSVHQYSKRSSINNTRTNEFISLRQAEAMQCVHAKFSCRGCRNVHVQSSMRLQDTVKGLPDNGPI